MAITVEAVYEDGVRKLDQPVLFQAGERVRVTIETKSNWVQETAGILSWKGDPEELRRLALHPDLDLEESP